MILVTDTHLGLYKSSETWHKVVLELFREIVDTALRRGEDTLLHLGDFFDERKGIDSRTLQVVYEIIELLEPLQTYIIPGNHDLYYKNRLDTTSLKVFEPHKHIRVVYEPYALENELLIPWGSFIPKGSGYKYCFGHFDINGFLMNSKKECDNGKYSVNDFDILQLSG